MFASISLTSYNRPELSKYCIKSISKTTPKNEFEFIVIDNSSKITTTNMLRKHGKHFDKLMFNHKNNLGSAINLAWKLASKKTEWLIVFDNDDFCMKGWFENFKKLAKSKLKPDVIYCQMRTPEFDRHKIRETKEGAIYYTKNAKNWYGAGLAIKKDVVDRFRLKFVEGDEPWTGGSIYSHFGKRIDELGLRIVHLGKPCVLVQDCQYANPEYKQYYEEVFSYKHRRGGKIAYNEISKFESLRRRGGHINNPDEYYEGSGYEIGKHYREALNSEQGKAEFSRLNALFPTKEEFRKERSKRKKIERKKLEKKRKRELRIRLEKKRLKKKRKLELRKEREL